MKSLDMLNMEVSMAVDHSRSLIWAYWADAAEKSPAQQLRGWGRFWIVFTETYRRAGGDTSVDCWRRRRRRRRRCDVTERRGDDWLSHASRDVSRVPIVSPLAHRRCLSPASRFLDVKTGSSRSPKKVFFLNCFFKFSQRQGHSMCSENDHEICSDRTNWPLDEKCTRLVGGRPCFSMVTAYFICQIRVRGNKVDITISERYHSPEKMTDEGDIRKERRRTGPVGRPYWCATFWFVLLFFLLCVFIFDFRRFSHRICIGDLLDENTRPFSYWALRLARDGVAFFF